VVTALVCWLRVVRKLNLGQEGEPVVGVEYADFMTELLKSLTPAVEDISYAEFGTRMHQ
jgi:hypothetical protein